MMLTLRRLEVILLAVILFKMAIQMIWTVERIPPTLMRMQSLERKSFRRFSGSSSWFMALQLG